MKRALFFLLGTLLGALLVSPARAQMAVRSQDAAVMPTSQPTATTACDGVCVAPEDMATLLSLAKEEKCLKTSKPVLKMDPLVIVTDKDGRVYYSGAAPHPYTLTIDWCDYSVKATGKLDVTVAMQQPPEGGFRLRPKAYLGYMLAEPFRSGNSAKDGIDAGLLIEPLYFHSFNLDLAVGFRSFGGGLGVDITKNFGAYAGYAMSWDGFHSNPEVSLWFAFW